MKRLCSGCGVKVQSLDPLGRGYLKPLRPPPLKELSVPLPPLPSGIYSPDQIKVSKDRVCMRCHNLSHQSLFPCDFQSPTLVLKMLHELSSTSCVLILTLDLLDLGSNHILTSLLHQSLLQKPTIWVGTKANLLPPTATRSWLQKKLSNQLKPWISSTPPPFILTDAISGQGLTELMDQLCLHRSPAFMLGLTNSGKSRLFNALCQQFHSKEGRATTSVYPGTTLGRISTKLKRSNTTVEINDMPGIYHPDQLLHQLASIKELSAAVPSKAIQPTRYRLKSGQSLYLGGLVRIDVEAAALVSLDVFVSSKLSQHRCSTAKAQELYKKHLGSPARLLVPPFGENAHERLLPLERALEIQGSDLDHEVSLLGLGWITLKSTEPASIKIHTPGGKGVSYF